MSQHTVQDAKLADLIDGAFAGEGVVITRDGQTLATLNPVRRGGRAMTSADLDWLALRRVPVRAPGASPGNHS